MENLKLDLSVLDLKLQEAKESKKLISDMVMVYMFQPDHPRIQMIENTLIDNMILTEHSTKIGGCLTEEQLTNDEDATIEEVAQN